MPQEADLIPEAGTQDRPSVLHGELIRIRPSVFTEFIFFINIFTSAVGAEIASSTARRPAQLLAAPPHDCTDDIF